MAPSRLELFRPTRSGTPVAAGILTLLLVLSAPGVRADSGDVIDTFIYPGIAPQGITRDGTDGTYWIPSLLDGEIRHFDVAGNPLGSIPSPFGPGGRPTGIAWYPLNDTLLVVNSLDAHLIEIDKTGVPGGIDLVLPVGPVSNPGGPVVRGVAVHMAGGSGIGSLYAVETVGAQIYEFDLLGFVIRSFDHPQDPDGYPGQGAGAAAGGIELLLDPQGQLVGIDLVGADQGVPEILRLFPDGTPSGYEIPLAATNAGGVGGIVRAVVVDPVSMLPVEAVVGTSESTQEIFIVDGSLPQIAQLADLVCTDGIAAVTLSWLPGPGYDEIILERDGDLLATLPGSATGYVDSGLADGVFVYSIRGISGTLATDSLECTRVIGAGQVIDVVIVDGIHFGLDITEGAGLLWISTDDGVIRNYTKDLQLNGEIPCPFQGPDDDPAGIAYRPETGTLLVVNGYDNLMQEIDLAGTPIGAPVLLAVPVPDDDPTAVGAIAYDPNGNGGDGEIWAVDSSRALVHRCGRDGALLGTFTHPDELFEPTPDPSFINTYALGISGVPEIGGGFDQIDLAGGTVFDRQMTRIVRVDASTGEPAGFQLPHEGMNAVRNVRYYSFVNSEHLGELVTYAIGLRTNETRLYEVRRTPPPIAPIDFLRCEQPDLVDRTVITFANHGPYDAIEVERDGMLIATLSGTATAYTDTSVVPGRHHYRVTPVLGGVSAEPRDCELRIGIGARLGHVFLDPGFSPYQMAREPSDGSFVVTTNSGNLADSMFRFDAAGTFLGTIPAPETPPWLVAALAIRPTPTGSEIWSITWEVRTPWLQPQEFHLTVQDMAGTILSGPSIIAIPGAPVGVSLTYPAAMVHDAESDTFWFLERNTDIFWQMGLDGTLLSSLDHPQPPLQPFVFNLGLALDVERDEFTATSSGPFDTQITLAIGMSRDGHLTGTAIPLEESKINPLNAIARAGPHLYAAGSQGSIPLLVTLKAADAVAPPVDLSCSETAANVVTLTWDATVAYDFVAVRRGGVEIAVIAGTQSSYQDLGVGNGPRVFAVAGRTPDGESAPSICSIVVAGLDPQFVRGDVNEDGAVNLADPISILGYLFGGADPPNCFDAADANDSGAVDIADVIYLLDYLFTSGLPPEPPFPNQGADPTGDLIGC